MQERSPYRLKIIVLLSVVMTALVLLSTLAASAALRTSFRKQFEENGRNTLAQLRSSVEIILTTMDDSLVQMAMDSEVQSFADRYELLDIFDCEEIYQRLYLFRAVNRYIEKLYIHYYHAGMVLDLNGKDPRLAPLETLEDCRNIEQATSRTLAARYDYPITLLNLAPEGEPAMLYVTKPAPPISYTPSAVIVVTLRQTYLQEILQAISLDDACNVYVTDSDGRYLFGKEQPETAKRGALYTVESFAEDTGWTFHYEIPESLIGRKVADATRFLWAITIGMIGFSVVGVWFLSQELYKPMRQLIQDKETAERLFEENKPFLLQDTLLRLLDASDTPDAEWRAKLQRYGAGPLAEGYHGVMILAFEQFEDMIRTSGETSLERFLLCRQQAIRNAVGDLPQVTLEILRDRRPAKLILLVSLCCESEAEAAVRLNETAQLIFDTARREAPLPVAMGCGRPCSRLCDVHTSYEEALSAYQYRAVAGNDRILFADMLPDLAGQGFVFPNRLAQQVFKAIRRGDDAILQQQLDAFFRCVRRTIYPDSRPSYAAVQFFNAFLQFLQELSIDAHLFFPDLPGESAQLMQIETLDALEEYFRPLAARIMEYLRRQREQPQERMSQIILAFLDQHFADEDISLTLVAGELHFSPSHLAREFKADTGKSIKEYITEKRIRAAKQLLADPTVKVGDVARKVGYSNARSFINIFKKYTGLTPGEYKEQL